MKGCIQGMASSHFLAPPQLISLARSYLLEQDSKIVWTTGDFLLYAVVTEVAYDCLPINCFKDGKFFCTGIRHMGILFAAVKSEVSGNSPRLKSFNSVAQILSTWQIFQSVAQPCLVCLAACPPASPLVCFAHLCVCPFTCLFACPPVFSSRPDC